jgi:hypothetical protein
MTTTGNDYNYADAHALWRLSFFERIPGMAPLYSGYLKSLLVNGNLYVLYAGLSRRKPEQPKFPANASEFAKHTGSWHQPDVLHAYVDTAYCKIEGRHRNLWQR